MRAGTLFTQDYLARGVQRVQAQAWAALVEALPARRAALRAVFDAVADPRTLNEAQTEERIVKPVLELLGWGGCWSVQERAEQQGRRNVPDYLLFADPAAFAAADGGDVRVRYRHAAVVADAKRWGVSLDRRDAGAGQDETPAGQILRYLERARVASDGRVRFGLLTDGRVWRLYFTAAKSQLQDFLQIDLAWALGLPGAQGELGDLELTPDHALLLFLHFFGRDGFVPDAQGRTVHDVGLEEGRSWETRVRDSLAETVFRHVYPALVRGLIAGDPERPPTLDPAYLAEVRHAALTALYRLLFCLYAEDRELLPRRDPRFDDYTLTRLRRHVEDRIEGARGRDSEEFSARLDNLWRQAANLFELIDVGDHSLGVPPYNGGLFARDRSALLERSRLSDRAFAPILDALSRREEGGQRLRINYRDLSVRELGSIYERLLEHEPVADAAAPEGVAVRLNPFARKGSGSYYTPDVLVALIVERTLRPLVDERRAAFAVALEALDAHAAPETVRAELDLHDPAGAVLRLRVCDPAMGSGHFLVSLVDWLALEAQTAVGEARALAAEHGHEWLSPLQAEIEALRDSIAAEADAHGWGRADQQLDDANLLKRLVLKRCVFGVDKNPMAVELAKVALWLHTFTAGAPLSFLDHHLRCGDSLFGEWVDEVAREAEPHQGRGRPPLLSGSALFLGGEISRALGAETAMRAIEALADGVLTQVRESESRFADVEGQTKRLCAFLDFRQALRWLRPGPDDAAALRAFLDGQFGRPLEVLAGEAEMIPPPELAKEDGQIDLLAVEAAPEQLTLLPGQAGARDYVRALRLVRRARELAKAERFLHWQVAFPGVWRGWRDARTGGFDAVIGNPPWDRMKMQEVEWFADRAPAIARQVRAADRKAAVAALRAEGDPLALAYDLAAERAEAAMRVAREGGAYPLMSRGDINLYSLFVERAQALLRPEGAAGLLTPSGVASDLTAAPFFKSLSTAGRVLTLFDFENRRGEKRPHFFPDVDSRFKFCAFVSGGAGRTTGAAECAFFLQDPPAADDPRVFRMTAEDFARVNPNTGTAPIFRGARDAAITRAIYERLPVLVDRSGGAEVRAWPVRYATMFHMTNDSRLFWSRARLDAEGAFPIGSGRWRKDDREWLPLYSGRMIQLFNHRAAGVEVNEENLHNAALSDAANEDDLSDPRWSPTPQYWVDAADIDWPYPAEWGLAFRDIARSTDVRTFISAVVPKAGFGNKAPLIVPADDAPWGSDAALLAGNLNALPFDYVARSKVMSTSVNWFIVEQLPVIPPTAYARRFGALTAGEIVRDHVLRLSYTAHDLAPFARDMGWVDEAGEVKPPFRWDEAERRQLRARLDALYFHLYGVTEAADVDHVLSTFPIVARRDREAHGVFLTRELVRWHMRALLSGGETMDAPVDQLIADARREARRAA